MQDFKKGGNGFGFKQADVMTIKTPDFKVPDPHDAARLAGMKDIDLKALEEKEEAEAREKEEREGVEAEQARVAAQEREERRKRRRLICFCGDDACRIGAFTKIVEEDG